MNRFIIPLLLFFIMPLSGVAATSNYLKVAAIARCGEQIVMAHKATRQVVIYADDGVSKVREWQFDAPPTGIAVGNERLYVTTFEERGELFVINLTNGRIVKRIDVGSGACSPTLSPNKLYVCNQFASTVTQIDRQTLKVEGSLSMLREPCTAAYDEKRNRLYVANFLPLDKATKEDVGGRVAIIDCSNFSLLKEVQIATGSNALRGVAISPDGEYLFVTHNLGRFQLPTTQLQQGWMNTSAMSIIDLSSIKYIASILLDEPDRGAAGVWDVKCSDTKIAISHSGVHEVSIIEYAKFKERFENYTDKESLAYNLGFLGDLRKRIAVKGNGPRAIEIVGDKLFIPTYFSDTLNVLLLNDDKVISSTAMVENRVEDDVLLGEKYFNDATFCFQNWQSCNGCHPGDARTDGLNWDLINDGIGNPKSCKSLLFSHKTPPAMISGIRESSYLAVRTGFKFIQFYEVPDSIANCVDKYLLSLEPVPSPYLIQGRKLSAKAKRGKKVYKELGCDVCHYGEYYTDMKMYRIGDDVEFENGWDNPTLREVWRTAPYLFDGRATTMSDVFYIHKHGINKEVSNDDMDALVEYVLSL